MPSAWIPANRSRRHPAGAPATVRRVLDAPAGAGLCAGHASCCSRSMPGEPTLGYIVCTRKRGLAAVTTRTTPRSAWSSLPGGDPPGQRPPVQPGTGDGARPAAEPAADRPVRTTLGGGQATATCPATSSSRSAATGTSRSPCPGARVALVVGDVAGHGVRAAVTMGRLRTAIQTLAMLELPPAESLQQLNELMQKMGETRAPLRDLRICDLRRGHRIPGSGVGRAPAPIARPP
jgi:hypothetical protein